MEETPTSDVVPFYVAKPKPDFSQREEIFNAILPKLHAFYRPRRHSYGVGVEIATLLAYVLDVPGPQRQALLFNRAFLKTAARKVMSISKKYGFAVAEGRGSYSPLVLKQIMVPGVQNTPWSIRAHEKALRGKLLARIMEVNERFLFKEPVIAKMALLEETLVNECFSDASVLPHEMDKAQKIYIDWFCEYWNDGEDAAKALLRERTWNAQDFEADEEQKAQKIKQFDTIISAIQSSKIRTVTIPSTFHSFSRLPVELRVRIWKMTWEPRVVEVQGSIRHKFDRMADKEGNELEDPINRIIHEYRVVEDEEGDEWVYRSSGKARMDREQKYWGKEGMHEEDMSENYNWSARPVYELLEDMFNQDARTEVEFVDLLKGRGVLKYENPLPSLCRGLPAESDSRHSIRLADGEFYGNPPQPTAPGKRAIQIAGVLSRIKNGKCPENYKWPNMPSYQLVHTIFKKIENGKDDNRILKELEEIPELFEDHDNDDPSEFHKKKRQEDQERSMMRQDSIDRDYEHEDEIIRFSSPAAIPSSLHVCRESRAESKRHYDLAFNDRSSNLPGIWINYALDTVLCISQTFGNKRLEGQRSLESLMNGGWVAAFEHWDRETQVKIRKLAIGNGLFTTYAKTAMRDRFPALEEVKVILNNKGDSRYRGPLHSRDDQQIRLRYELVGYYKAQLAYKEQFPDHDNDFFRDPFRRYWDAERWIPGFDGPRGPYDEWFAGEGNEFGHRENFPGHIIIGPEYIKAIQRLPVTFIPPPKELSAMNIQDFEDWNNSVHAGQENATLTFIHMKRGGLEP